MHSYICCRTVYNSHDMDATSMSVSRWMGREDVGHTHSGMLLDHKMLPFAANG